MTDEQQHTDSASSKAGSSKADGGSVEVSEVVPRPLETVWERLTTSDGIEAFLGRGARLGGKGEPWHSEDGTHGVVRSYHPMEQIRVSWHADADASASLVDLRLTPDGAGTRLELHHENLAPGAVQDELRQRWQGALQRLAEAT